ncbi:MarR family winged helix-turn-helix transcriptional regulator [Promicromonospora sp. NPDC023987]|uniref:MarR family winged helix-turn-helix transcriptional regulator n=1 Tax=Promicromonospora sp. NPDC023987 TaxID=3155360 RepID=UPI0034007094
MSNERTTAELLRDAFRWFADGVEVRSAEADEPSLSPGASMVMSYLDDEPISPSALARRMQVSRQRVHVVIRELIAAGMVQLNQDPRSARDKLIQATPAGRRRRLRVLDALSAREQNAARTLGDADLVQLRALLARLVESGGGDTPLAVKRRTLS